MRAASGRGIVGPPRFVSTERSSVFGNGPRREREVTRAWLRALDREDRLRRKLQESQSEAEWLYKAFDRLKALTFAFNVELVNKSQSRHTASRDGNLDHLEYQLELRVIQIMSDSLECELSLVRNELVHRALPTEDPIRSSFSSVRKSGMVVARTVFIFDRYLLQSSMHDTYVTPTLGLFHKTLPPQTFEGRHFFSLLMHMKMLYAATLQCVFEVSAQTPATYRLLSTYYKNVHIADFSGDAITTHHKFEDDDAKWFTQASGYYAASKEVMDIVMQKKTKGVALSHEEKETMQRDNKAWSDHIWWRSEDGREDRESILGDWLKRAEAERRVLFNARAVSNPYLIFAQ